ncbi:hypothetical protein [Delftia acidovorans]|uniref:hypothetical protein n=1 Tax=Delftia acidovorans TaxID=80866 RepID=UPI0028EB72DF|nr:hypothetical protein [Delftia acidovorans]
MKQQKAPQPPDDARARHLSLALGDMDLIVQRGCTQIAAIVDLSLAWLEHPEGHQRIETVAQALEAIRSSASALAHAVSEEARPLDCASTDQPAQRRRNAAQTATLRFAQAFASLGTAPPG